jgi:para-nitrobenzyl esterase
VHTAAALVLAAAAACAGPADAQPEDRTATDAGGPIVAIESGRVRGVTVPDGFVFRGLPYAAPPTGNLRWQPPRPPARWNGVRDATAFAPSCPQPMIASFTKGPQDEDCLYLNVYTPELGHRSKRALPVLVWIHGGGFTVGAGRDYDATKLAASGAVVVTINHRLGALGFLSHPALASRRGEPSGNYGLMDQQAISPGGQPAIAAPTGSA